ncbi:uncharacterized protein METZ01_LOCUS160015, partial [marine metagenome]
VAGPGVLRWAEDQWGRQVKSAGWWCGDLSRLTVVVLSKSRPEYLLRQAVFWSGSPVRLLIMDGSDEPLPDGARDLLARETGIDYHHRPSSISARFTEASHLIETPYTVLLGDDEFHLPAGLCASIRRLDEDLDMVGCIGQSLFFRPMGKARRWVYDVAYPHWKYERDEPTIGERLEAAFDPYTPTTPYAVLRTPVWQRAWGGLREWTSPVAFELQQAIVVHGMGRVGSVDEVQWLRSVENPRVDQNERKLIFVPWWQCSEYDAEHKEFVLTVADVLESELGVSQSEAVALVRRAIGSYLGYWERRSRNNPSPFVALVERVTAWLKTTGATVVEQVFGGGGRLLVRRVRVRLGEVLGRPSTGYLGTVEDIASRAPEGLIETSPDLADQLLEAEDLIVSFYRSSRDG